MKIIEEGKGKKLHNHCWHWANIHFVSGKRWQPACCFCAAIGEPFDQDLKKCEGEHGKKLPSFEVEQ